MSNSLTYENWENQQPQVALKVALEADTIPFDFLSSRVKAMTPLLDNVESIISVYNALRGTLPVLDNSLNLVNSNGEAAAFNTDKAASNTDKAAINTDKAAFAKLIMQVLHIVSKHKPVSAPSTDGNMRFKIEANGDVVALDSTGKVLATAYAHANINKEHFALCEKFTNSDDKSNCAAHMAFVAGVHNGNYADVNADKLTKFLGKNATLNDNSTDKESQVINAFSILRRIGWRAKSDDSAVYTFADFSMEELKDVNLRKTLNYMLDPSLNDASWNTMNSVKWNNTIADNNLTPFGKLVKQCIENVNREPQILRAQIGNQRFSQNNNSGRIVRGRLEALKIRPSYLDSITAHMRGQSSRVPTIILSGGSNSADATNALRHALDAAMANLERHGKRLSSDTYRKFTNKLEALATTETEINTFLANLNDYGNSNVAKTTAGHTVTADDIKNFQAKSKKAAETTWTLQTGIANINLRLTQEAPTVSKPASYNLM